MSQAATVPGETRRHNHPGPQQQTKNNSCKNSSINNHSNNKKCQMNNTFYQKSQPTYWPNMDSRLIEQTNKTAPTIKQHSCVGRSGEHLVTNLAPRANKTSKSWPNLTPRWTMLAPSWLHVGPKLVQVDSKLAPSWPKITKLAPSWHTIVIVSPLRHILAEIQKKYQLVFFHQR